MIKFYIYYNIYTHTLTYIYIYIYIYIFINIKNSGKLETVHRYWPISKIHRTAGQTNTVSSTVLTLLVRTLKGKELSSQLKVKTYNFDQNLIQYSNFTFIQSSSLSFKFIQLKHSCQLLLDVDIKCPHFAIFKTLKLKKNPINY